VNSTVVLISDEETDVDSDSDELEYGSDDWIEAGIEELSNNEFETTEERGSNKSTEEWDRNKPTEAGSESSNDANSLLVSNAGSTSSNCDARCCNGNTNDGSYQPKLNYALITKRFRVKNPGVSNLLGLILSNGLATV